MIFNFKKMFYKCLEFLLLILWMINWLVKLMIELINFIGCC